ncbi:MAG TPA: GNAT family N-acetyltransferase [Thermomicrobiales bacterium]|nr:GNAT family N-acetyltransferase [Thermomicrobiales bacterium]
MMSGEPPQLTVTPAVPHDRPSIAAILEGARRWMTDQGIKQWALPFGADWLDPKIAAGEFWVVRSGGEPIAVVRLLWADPLFWAERDDGSAAYVHTLAVRRDHAGQGIGLWVLRWAEEKARAAGRRVLRLDCAASNPALLAYYERAGFTAQSLVKVGHATVMLFEKTIAS